MAKPTELVNQFYDAWNKKDLNAMANLLSDNAVYEGPLVTWKGKNEYLEGAKQILPGFGGMKVLKQFSDGNSVCYIMDLKINTPDGPITCHISEVDEVSNGKIVGSKTYYDPRKIEKYCTPQN